MRPLRLLVSDFTKTRIAIIAVIAACAVIAAPLTALAAEVVHRSAGVDRISTAVAASEDHRSQATDALLATATSFPDALSAGALAASLDAPLLLTMSSRLPRRVAAELDRLGVETVWILGGTAVVSRDVERTLRERGYEIRRLAGTDRFETAAEIATKAGPAASGEVVVALGSHPEPARAWPDAVASGALAASPDRLPTLLTAHDRLPQPTVAALAELDPDDVLLVGGTSAITKGVEDEIAGLGYAVTRIAGSTRYETSVELARNALARMPEEAQTVVFATGGDYPDALTAGALAGNLAGPLVLIPQESLTDSVDAFLRERTERWSGGVLVGGSAAASDFVLEQINAAVQDAPAPERIPEPEPEPEEEIVGVFEGTASWYGGRFHGRGTASGETFDRDAYTAAHRSLPFGTHVRVTNRANGKQVVVRINDRGPYHGGRVMDLSEAAFAEIGSLGSGTIQVRGEVLAD